MPALLGASLDVLNITDHILWDNAAAAQEAYFQYVVEQRVISVCSVYCSNPAAALVNQHAYSLWSRHRLPGRYRLHLP